MTADIDLDGYSDDDLLRLWKRIPEALRQRGICRTSNVVSDVAERLVAQSLGLTLSANSTRGYDATSASGERYQIKSRLLTGWNDSRQLSDIHHLRPSDPFEFLIAVFFREDFPRPFAVFKIPVAIVHQFVRKKGGRDVLIVKGPILNAPGVEDITSKVTA